MKKTNSTRMTTKAVLILAALAVMILAATSVYAAKNATNYEKKYGPYPGEADYKPAYLKMYEPNDAGKFNFYILYEDGQGYSIWDEGVFYIEETNTLKLENFKHPDWRLRAYMMGDDFRIQVVGDCEIGCIEVDTGTYYGEKDEPLYWGGSLTIDGTGTLTVNKGDLVDRSNGILLWSEGCEANVEFSKSVSVDIYGFDYKTPDEPVTPLLIWRSAGFYSEEAVTVGHKYIHKAKSNYTVDGFMDEVEPTLKNYWVKSNLSAIRIELKGTGKAEDMDVPDPEKLDQEVILKKTTYNKTYGDPRFQLEVETTGYGMPIYDYSDTGVVSVDESGRVTILGAGTAEISVHAEETEEYKASPFKTITIKVKKADNTLKVKGKTATVKYSKLKKKAQKIARSKVITIQNGGQGKITYTKKSGNKKITINQKTGKVTVKKGLKKGTYSVKVKVSAKGDANHLSATKTVTFKVKVK